jgi:hypothetical protein
MKALIATILVTAATAAFAANLVGQIKQPNGSTVCVYSDGTSFVTTFNNCPSIK